jgi:hypothetical protein
MIKINQQRYRLFSFEGERSFSFLNVHKKLENKTAKEFLNAKVKPIEIFYNTMFCSLLPYVYFFTTSE